MSTTTQSNAGGFTKFLKGFFTFIGYAAVIVTAIAMFLIFPQFHAVADAIALSPVPYGSYLTRPSTATLIVLAGPLIALLAFCFARPGHFGWFLLTAVGAALIGLVLTEYQDKKEMGFARLIDVMDGHPIAIGVIGGSFVLATAWGMWQLGKDGNHS